MPLRIVAPVGLAVVIGVLGYSLVTADPSNTKPFPDPTDAVPAGPEAGKSFPIDPTLALSDEERGALYEQGWKDFESQYTAWLEGLDLAKLDLHSLPRYGMNAQYVPGERSLDEALARADLVIVGTVSDFKPTPFSGTQVTLSVDDYIKGESSAEVVVTQAGGLRPTEDWAGVVIAQGLNEPLLLPGDRAVLLLQKDKDGSHYVQSVSGWFQVIGGNVNPNPFNDWGTSVNGNTEAAFVQQLTAATQ